ncbi:hypothetical protein CHUAL_004571 [Chamberlinius hualienensis]
MNNAGIVVNGNSHLLLPPNGIMKREELITSPPAAAGTIDLVTPLDFSLKINNGSLLSESNSLEKKLSENTARNDRDKLVLQAKQEFHSKRHLILKNVSTNATDEDVRKALGDGLDIKEVIFNRSSQTAKVTLVSPEDLDSWPSGELHYEMLDQMTTIRVSDTDGVLCVVHLPFIYTEEDFSNLVQMYGPVVSCFLCRSEKSGEHKGYGFVEYSSREVAFKAKPLLEQKIIGDCQIKCFWLEPSHVTYSSLHSKCLFVDHLPAGYRDMVEFRKTFSVVCSPSYCQIGIKNGQPLGFGLVEFDESEDAEETQRLLNHSKLGDHQIRVTYCAPGYRAMVIYNKLASGLALNGKQPLLPDPPRNTDMNHMLSMNNTHVYQSQQNGINGRSWENGHRNGHTNGNYNDSQQLPIGAANSNTSLQEAVILLLAAQVQSQLGMQQAPVCNNLPSLTLMLQAALGQQGSLPESLEVTDAVRNLMTLLQQTNGQTRCSASNGSVVNGNSGHWQPAKSTDGKTYNKVPLLPDPPCVKQMDSGGLLPTPPITKIHPNAFCGSQVNFMNSALHNGSPTQPCFVKTQTEMISKTPYDNQGRQKVPLLGDKPSNVLLTGPNSVGAVDRSGFPLLNSSNSNGNIDPNSIAQLLAPLILKQSLLMQNAKISKINENLAFQQIKTGSGIQPSPAIVNLLLQSIQRLQQPGDLNKTPVVHNQNGFQFPLNVSYPSPNFFLGASSLAQKPLMFGGNPLVSPPPPTPAPTRPNSHVLTMTPPVAPKQPVFTQPFLFQSPSQAGPLAAAQLMAEIQQRGSLLGDFWHATPALGSSHLANLANGKMVSPLITTVGYPGLTKRKMSFAPEVDISAEQLKKRRI